MRYDFNCPQCQSPIYYAEDGRDITECKLCQALIQMPHPHNELADPVVIDREIDTANNKTETNEESKRNPLITVLIILPQLILLAYILIAWPISNEWQQYAVGGLIVLFLAIDSLYFNENFVAFLSEE